MKSSRLENNTQLLPSRDLERILQQSRAPCIASPRMALALRGTSQSEPILDEQRALIKRIACSRLKEVSAFQVYAPPEKEFIALEPQFNYADPYGKEWGKTKTDMVNLQPGASVTYRVRLELFQPNTGSNP